MKEEIQKFDVCIIGAGVAGATIAAYLGKNNVSVVVVEKNWKAQERIVGELLQPGGVEQLEQMGLEHILEGIDAQTIEGYALFLNKENFKIKYPENKTGRGFHNHHLVQNIRSYLEKIASVKIIEGTVINLWENEKQVYGVVYKNKNEEEEKRIAASLTIICDGSFSLFRKNLTDSKEKVSSWFLGMILKETNLPFTGFGHVIVAKPSPVLCYPITSSETRILIDFPGTTPPKKGEDLRIYLKEKVGNQMPIEILPSFINAVEEGKFKVMPNHIMPAKPIRKSGVVLVGDALNMRHPLTGGGMSVALSDVCMLGKKIMEVNNELEQKKEKIVSDFYTERHENIATVNILADALYGVLSKEDLKNACFNYLKKGGNFAAEPISILSAISRDRDLLLRHFFSVAWYGAKNIIGLSPTPQKIKRSYKMLQDAVYIVSPLVLNENPKPISKTTFKIAQKIF